MFCPKNILSKSIFLFLFLTSSVSADNLSLALMHDKESSKVLYMNAKDRLMRAQSEYTIKRIADKNMFVYELTSQGAGQYDKFKDIVFTRVAKMIEEEGRLKILYSKTTIKDKTGKLRTEFIKTYDYTDQKVVFRRFSGTGKLLERETFNLKGPTCDDVTLAYFLKVYVKNYDHKDAKDFYLITNEPERYHVRLIDKGEEALEIPLGDFEARKFQLMAELGPITKWVAKVVPKTYVWYKKDYPHDWLQYEGLERGYTSDKILVHPIERTPPLD